MKKPKIVFLGSKKIGAACLNLLFEFEEQNLCTVDGIFTNKRGSEILRLAEKKNIRTHEKLDALLSFQEIDYLVSVQFDKILRRVHLEQCAVLPVNLHMAPLPEYRGCNQFSFAILNRDEEFGTTLHVMNEGVDSGDILAERRFPISKECFVGDLYDLTFQHSVDLFKEKMPAILAGDLSRRAQNTFLGERKCETHRRSEIHDIRKINLNWPEERILRHIRATSMKGFSPPYAEVLGKKVELVASA